MTVSCLLFSCGLFLTCEFRPVLSSQQVVPDVPGPARVVVWCSGRASGIVSSTVSFSSVAARPLRDSRHVCHLLLHSGSLAAMAFVVVLGDRFGGLF